MNKFSETGTTSYPRRCAFAVSARWAVGLTGRDGGLIRARQMKLADKDDPSKEHDIGQVGEITAIDPSVVKALQDDQFIPVISPIGFGERNESYNINADLVAAKLASVLKAEKLIMLTNIRGVLNKAGELITELTPRQIDELVADGTIGGGMLPKLAGAIDAARSRATPICENASVRLGVNPISMT